MEYAPVAILSLFLIYILLRPLMVLLHELGHAIPLVLMTKQSVTVYVGSYGDKQDSFFVKLGLISLWIRYNPRRWRGGLCMHASNRLPAAKRVIYLLGGVIMSFLVSIFFFYIAFRYDMHGFVKEVAVIAAFSGITDAALNLTPRIITTRTGRVIYSDGYQLANVHNRAHFEQAFAEGNEWFRQKEYEKAIQVYESLLPRNHRNEGLYKMLHMSHMLQKDYEKAFALQNGMEQFTLTANDLYNMGLGALFLKKEEKHDYFKRALALDPDHYLTLNAVGYCLNQQMKFAEALPLFDRAVAGMPHSAHAWNNRGHARIELGEPEAGLQDIEHSLTLDAENSYAWRNLGIYHLYKGDKEKALPLFEKARMLDWRTDMINELIERAH